MDLAIDETQELTVFAFPATEGLFEDSVMCRLRDNPTPLEFPISVVGAKPSVAVKLNVPAVSHEPSGKTPTGLRRATDAGTAAKGAAAKGAKPVAEYIMQFDRLLLNRKDSQSFTVSNTGVVPFKWQLAGATQLPPDFKVYPSSGELPAGKHVCVTVEFTAIKKQELSELVTLEVLDIQEALGISRSIPMAIRGEAYDIHVDIKFPQENFAGVDYGPLRVVDSVAKQLVLKNTEKYDVKFSFAIRNETVKQLVQITPESGVVLPNKEVQVMVHWNKDLSLRQEVILVNNTDIVMTLIEPSTDNKEQQVPIKLSAHAQFSHYAITPARGLHFGPVTYNTVSKPRTFEVVNLGNFPFTLRITAMGAEKPTEEVVGKAGKGSKTAGKRGSATPEPPAGSLQLGQFTLEPAEAVIKPGARQEVSVVFKAEGNICWSAVAALGITERDFRDQPEGIRYELAGESCIPGGQ
eukprot:GHRR01034590.1.p1 GENE.GHRR01034590.1~~GHRR01034590.1.p1  ORF type:complete len:525 (+),score=187.16 GHRR01034590.1:182-1576(+)